MAMKVETKPEKAKTLFDSLSILQMGALDTKEEFEAFYVSASQARNADEQDRTTMTMLSIQAAKNPCHILFSGHLGCGKSTELWRLCNLLEDNNYLVGLGICDDNLDMTTVKYTDLILFILETLLRCARDKKIPVRTKSLENIENYWKEEYTEITEVQKSAGIEIDTSIEGRTPTILAKVFSVVASVRGSLRTQSDKREEYRRKMEPSLNLFIGMVNDVIKDIRTAGIKKGFKDAPPIVLLDQLEKANREVAAELFEKHSQDLVRLNVHLVVPFPIEMRYTPNYNQIKNYFSCDWILPMIKLRSWDDQKQSYASFDIGKEVLRNIIFKRMDDTLFAEGVLDYIIEKTGGFLRDLFTVIFDAALNGTARKSNRIEEKDMMVALTKLQSGISCRFPESGRARLERIKNGEKRYASDEELMVFLGSGAVFEYNGKRWVDLHPLVEDWLEETRAEKEKVGDKQREI